MKVMFVGSNPKDHGPLAFERDITALQRRVASAAGLDVEFVFLPACTLEELPQELATHRPDVLHFSSHGEASGHLVLADATGRDCHLTGSMIGALVDPERPPKIVYLSACDSEQIAHDLMGLGLAAIGVTAPITNGAARASAVCFYDRLLRGYSVGQAHQASEAVLKSLNTTDVKVPLAIPKGSRLATSTLLRVPRLVAEPVRTPRWNHDGTFEIELRVGVVNYPMDTVRVAFFTPDSSFDDLGIDDAYTDDWTGNVCWSEGWIVNGDFLVVATGASPSQKTFAEATLASEAMGNCITLDPVHRKSTDDSVSTAIGMLTGSLRKTREGFKAAVNLVVGAKRASKGKARKPAARAKTRHKSIKKAAKK